MLDGLPLQNCGMLLFCKFCVAQRRKFRSILAVNVNSAVAIGRGRCCIGGASARFPTPSHPDLIARNGKAT